MNLTEEQKVGIDNISTWYKNNKKQMFILSGAAGTGKSTLIKYAIDNIGLSDTNVAFCTFTGRASFVLQRKGNPNASTIHRLIYSPVDDKYNKKITFELKGKSDLGDIKLIVVDEISMVSKNILDDLLSFDIKILAIGDKYQLPPIGEQSNLLDQSDYNLTTIHRQALENPIIWLSNEVRNGRRINLGDYGDTAKVVKNGTLSESDYLTASQVLVGKHPTRKKVNKYFRKLYNFKDIINQNEKIVFRSNNWNVLNPSGQAIINGMICYIDKTNNLELLQTPIPTFISKQEVDYDNPVYVIKNLIFKPDFSVDDIDSKNHFNNIPLHLNSIINDDTDKVETYDSIKTDRNICFANYGYGITVHSAQGSEFDNVILNEEFLGNWDLHTKWLYTGITRAKNNLIVVK